MANGMIIVGLGNPGPEYADTRHNVGWQVVDRLVRALDGSRWKKFPGLAAVRWGDHWIVKPIDFMNVSGPSLQSGLASLHLSPDPAWLAANLFVIHDDLDLPLGEIREQANRSSAGHQGVQSIIEAFGTQDFRRLRIGIGHNRDRNIPAEDYVLQPFTAPERSAIDQAVQQAVTTLIDQLGIQQRAAQG